MGKSKIKEKKQGKWERERESDELCNVTTKQKKKEKNKCYWICQQQECDTWFGLGEKVTAFTSLNYNSFSLSPLSLSSMLVGSSLDLWTKAQSFTQKAQRERIREATNKVFHFISFCFYLIFFFLLFSLCGQMSSSLLFFFFLLVWVSLVTLERKMLAFWRRWVEKGKVFMFNWVDPLRSTSGFCSILERKWGNMDGNFLTILFR